MNDETKDNTIPAEQQKPSSHRLLRPLAFAAASALLLAATIAGTTVVVLHVTKEPAPRDAGTDMGEVSFNSKSGEIWGPGVQHLIELVKKASDQKIKPNANAAETHEAVTMTLHEVQFLVGRALKEEGLSVNAKIDIEERLRKNVPTGATIVEHDGSDVKYATALMLHDNSEDWEALNLKCDGSRCTATRGRKLGYQADEVARWVCGPGCKMACELVTKVVERALLTWVCEPVAEFVCDSVLGAGNHELVMWHNESALTTCKEAVYGTCGKQYPLDTARMALRESVMRAFGIEEYDEDSVPDFVDLLLVQVAGLPQNNVTSVLERAWVETTEEVCSNVCDHWCTKVVVTVYTWVTSCYPAAAVVNVLPAPGATAVATPISEVAVGDLVQTPRGFEEVYFQGHASSASHPYVRVILDSGHTLELSPDHYLPIVSTVGESGYVLAKGAEPGMIVRRSPTEEAKVARVEHTILAGAYNPYTPSGEIIVNDVIASCHSSWFLEGSMSANLVPQTYQAMLAPVRGLYAMAPRLVKRFCDSFAGEERAMNELKLGEILGAISAASRSTENGLAVV